MIEIFEQDKDAIFDHSITWSGFYSGETISTSTWTAGTGVVLTEAAVVGADKTIVRVNVGACAEGFEFALKNVITLSSGRKDAVTKKIRVATKYLEAN